MHISPPKSNPKNLLQKEEAFTLIELIVVIIIIGILAAIAIPIFANQQKSAIAAAVQSDVVNAESLIPSPSTGRMNEPADFAKKITVTDTNVGTYYLSSNKEEACYQVTHEYSSTEKVSYRYLTSEGKVKEGNCDTFSTGSGVTTITVSNSTNETTPSPSPSNPGGGTIIGGGGTTGSTTNTYITPKVTIDSLNPDWSGVYTARVTITAKQNSVINWSLTWTDPSVTAIQTSLHMDCSVATGGVITCSGKPDHFSTRNFQWGETFNQTVSLKTTNKNTAPSNPTVYIVAEPN